MSGDAAPVSKATNLDELVYMVSGDDERGDHHIFVSTDKDRAEAKRQTMLALFTNVKANWLERS